MMKGKKKREGGRVGEGEGDWVGGREERRQAGRDTEGARKRPDLSSIRRKYGAVVADIIAR